MSADTTKGTPVDTVARILVGDDWDNGVPNTDIGSRETVSRMAEQIVAALRTAKPDEELDEVRAKAERWIGGNGDLAALLRMYDWLRDELEYAHRMTEWAREQRDGMGEAFDSVVKACGDMKRQRDQGAEAARPVHYREAAASLRAIADAWRAEMHTNNAVTVETVEFLDGVFYAADRLKSVAKDLEDEGATRE